jgi:DNA repair exonuclease SbcCD ATPase subunit
MLSKKEIEEFILSEAKKYINEQEESISVEEDIEKAKKALNMAEENHKNLMNQLTTAKNSASQIQGSTEKSTLSRKMANINVDIKKIDLKQSEETKKALEDRIKDLEKFKKESEKNTTKAEVSISENVFNNLSNQKEKLVSKKVTPSKVQSSKEVQKKPQKKDLIVKFDKKTANPFNVKFTTRGFLVGGTRLSFELLEKAISKNFSITLDNGLVLTPVKMQKIMKYKNRF